MLLVCKESISDDMMGYCGWCPMRHRCFYLYFVQGILCTHFSEGNSQQWKIMHFKSRPSILPTVIRTNIIHQFPIVFIQSSLQKHWIHLFHSLPFIKQISKKKSIPWLHFMANYPPRTQKSIEILTKPNSFLSLQPSSDWLCKTDRHAHRTACTLYIYILSELADLITTTPSPVYNRNIFVGCVETHSPLIEVHRRHTVCLRPPTVT